MAGLIHVYTGNGKGKTTAAVGLAVRALGFGLKVCYTSFHKNPDRYGYHEMAVLERLGARVLIFAKGHPHLDEALNEDELAADAARGLSSVAELLKAESFDLLVMDEILISVRDGYLAEAQLLEFIRCKPRQLELVLTGRGATCAVAEMADYVSEIRKVAHPYDTGIAGRGGIEF